MTNFQNKMRMSNNFRNYKLSKLKMLVLRLFNNYNFRDCQ